MMNMRLYKSLKAISPLVATIILLALTIAGGVVVYAIFNSASSSASKAAQITITSSSATIDTAGSVTLTLTVKNSGSMQLTGITGTYGGTSNAIDVTTFPTTGLAPGSFYASVTIIATGLTAGETYVLVVIATYLDGSTSTVSQPIVVQST